MKTDQIVVATAEHCIHVAKNLRPADAAEAAAMNLDPVQTTLDSFSQSLYTKAWLVDGKPAAVFGLASLMITGATGIPWLCTTDLVNQNRRKFVVHSRRVVAEMLQIFPHLENYVDARYASCLRWLDWAGFQVHPAAPIGPLQMPFHRVEKRA